MRSVDRPVDWTKGKGLQLTAPKLRIYSSGIDELTVGATLSDLASSQDNDLITIENRAESMCYEHTGATFLLQDAVDVLQKSLLRVGIQCRSLAIISLES